MHPEKNAYLATDVDMQWGRISRRAHGLLREMGRWTSRLRAMLRGRFIPHTGSAYVPVIRDLLTDIRPGRRAYPGTVPKRVQKGNIVNYDIRRFSNYRRCGKSLQCLLEIAV